MYPSPCMCTHFSFLSRFSINFCIVFFRKRCKNLRKNDFEKHSLEIDAIIYRKKQTTSKNVMSAKYLSNIDDYILRKLKLYIFFYARQYQRVITFKVISFISFKNSQNVIARETVFHLKYFLMTAIEK